MKSKSKSKEGVVPEIRILNGALLINGKILVLSDLHIGYEDIIAGKGVFPRTQLKDIIEKLNGVFWDLDMEGIKIKQIIICGDLKHEFGEISDVEWRETLKLLDYLIDKCKNIVLIKGNHDNILGPIAKKKEIKLKDYYKKGGVCFLHGNKIYEGCFADCSVVVMGHLHGAISISDKYKKEKYKCFLKGKWKGKVIYILPSFSDVSFGYDLIRWGDEVGRKGFLIIENSKLKKFSAIVYNNKDKKAYNFGKLKNLF